MLRALCRGLHPHDSIASCMIESWGPRQEKCCTCAALNLLVHEAPQQSLR